jgi:hypothetical protein
VFDCHDRPRAERTPSNYASQIIGSTADSLIALKYYLSDEEFLEKFFGPVVMMHREGISSEYYWSFVSNPEAHAAIAKITGRPDGSTPNPHFTYANLACLLCLECMRADAAGLTAEAWTYAVDARFASDAVLSQFHDIAAGQRARTAQARTAGAMRGEDKKEEARMRHEKWGDIAKALLATGKQSHNVSSIVAERVRGTEYAATAKAIREALQAQGIIEKRK